MEKSYWLERWESNRIDFNQAQASAYLERYWSKLNLKQGANVFVPLCGKSIDMLWLANHGYRVVGVELSLDAAKQFFNENNLEYTTKQENDFSVFQHAAITIYVGDFFKLQSEQLGQIDAIYDRAALIALPADMRKAYSQKLSTLFNKVPPTLLVTVTYDQNQMPGPPFSVDEAEVVGLYPGYKITHCHEEEFTEIPEHLAQKGLTAAFEHVFLLSA